jgi:hypothetical protein
MRALLLSLAASSRVNKQSSEQHLFCCFLFLGPACRIMHHSNTDSGQFAPVVQPHFQNGWASAVRTAAVESVTEQAGRTYVQGTGRNCKCCTGKESRGGGLENQSEVGQIIGHFQRHDAGPVRSDGAVSRGVTDGPRHGKSGRQRREQRSCKPRADQGENSSRPWSNDQTHVPRR